MIRIRMHYIDNMKAVHRAVREAQQDRRRLYRSAAWVRTVARRSIRRRKRAAPPGRPPSSHLGHLKNMIWFHVGRTDAIVGPAVRRRKTGAPRALEKSGRSLIYGRRRGSRRRGWFKSHIKARPYMVPAADQSKEKILSMWRNAVSS